MVTTAWFGDTHGNLKCMWGLALEWQEIHGQKIDWIFQVGDFGIYPSADRLDPMAVRYAEKHGYSLSRAVGDFPEVFLGDYEIPIPTYFIRGNHEDQEFLMSFESHNKIVHPSDYLTRSIQVCPNLHYVPDGHIVELDGYKIAGWGGCWGKKTWEMEYWGEPRARQNGKGYARRLNHMTRDAFERLVREQFDILVTHDAPTGSGVDVSGKRDNSLVDSETVSEDNPNGPGVPYIRELIETVQPQYQFGGHWHEFRKNQFGQTTAFVLDKTMPGEDNHCLEIVEL